MAYRFDPEILAALTAAAERFGTPPAIARGDWKALRARIDGFLAARAATAPRPVERVDCAHHTCIAADGATFAMRWYTRPGAATSALEPGPALLHFHGGGMVAGSLEIFHPYLLNYVAATGVPMLTVEYRLAPEHPHPTPVQDCFAALRWLLDHSAELSVDPARIAVMGESAGGGLAAGVTLLARDAGISLAQQILIYPMLDDRTTVPDPELAPFATWSYDDSFTGWSSLLGAAFGTDAVAHEAAPARAADLRHLPPAYIEVGGLDIFRDEDIEYARRLAAAAVPVELHVHPGAPHGFDGVAPHSSLARRAMADRHRVLQAL